MKIENSIGWCDETTNAVTGCDKVSPGCKNCYAATGTRARVLRAQGIETWGENGSRMPVAGMPEKLRRLNKLCVCGACRTGYQLDSYNAQVNACDKNLSKPPGAPYRCQGKLRRIRLFADSNSDWLDPKWPVAVLANFLNEIRLAPNVDVLLLTKRPENFRERLTAVKKFIDDPKANGNDGYIQFCFVSNWLEGRPPTNTWLGVSVENQKCADERIPELLKITAAVRFLSCEPLLEELSFEGKRLEWLAPFKETDADLNRTPRVDWVIVGGESGKDRRDCGVGAIVNVAEQCHAADVPVYVKQDCAFKSGQQGRIPDAIWALKQFPSGRGA